MRFTTILLAAIAACSLVACNIEVGSVTAEERADQSSQPGSEEFPEDPSADNEGTGTPGGERSPTESLPASDADAAGWDSVQPSPPTVQDAGLPGSGDVPCFEGDCGNADGGGTGTGADGSTAQSPDAGMNADAGADTDDSAAQSPDAGAAPVCYQEEFCPETDAPADLLLVVDRSGSMDEVPDGATLTKWQQITSVISDVVYELDSELGFGLMTYPTSTGDALQCTAGQVVVPIKDVAGPDISFALMVASPDGGTPTAPTLMMAHEYLSVRSTDRPQAVVLATDGAPNCNYALDAATCVCSQPVCEGGYACLDDHNAVTATAELAAAGIATFVIGIPGSELFALVLDRMAVAGGTPQQGARRYYSTSSSAELEQALRNIGERVAQCRFELSQEPPSDDIAVTINGLTAGRDTNRLNGWDYVGASTIEFFGPACETMSAGDVIAVEVCE